MLFSLASASILTDTLKGKFIFYKKMIEDFFKYVEKKI